MGKLQVADVENEYKKFPDLKREDVQKIREWMEKQPHLPKISELETVLFLHSNYFKMEATKQTIENYYTCRTHIPMFFANRDMLSAGTKKAMNTIYGLAFPQQTHEGCVVFYGALKDFDPTNFDMAEIFKLIIYVTDLHFLEKGPAAGYRIVIDMKGVLFGHVARLGVLPIKHFLYYLQDAMPIRLKGLHFTNIVPFMDTILALLKPFMKKELLDILYLHTSNEQMLQYIGKDCLPKDCGGECESSDILTGRYYQRLMEVKDYFLDEEKTRRVDEGKRPGKPKTAGEIFGVEGNFRKLDID
ncbi:alpha-tocopherol transfer protein-like isoform X1 [Topomyia yanbarensis]|uniref:alpha-tocopherol transfer protein-like isoform X1 n=1 Tax=Topomyia yanbarensis TaxID=2498891 RepID=UPI00273A980D|nr:alpha-tocopherol transfer protein-like isoform X1 [Topomyia yanbarensis]